jgi:hypothetical protein
VESGLFWGWGWLAGIGVIILLGVYLLPWFFFLMNLQALLSNLSPENRRMSPGKVWLNFIPIFQLGWFIYTVVKVRDSLSAEFKTRGWFVDGDLGYNVGLTAGVLWVASFVIGWIPFIGWVLPLAGTVCWIIYWLKISDLKNRLDARPAWNRGQPMMYPPAFPPYGARYPRAREFREDGWATAQAGEKPDGEATAEAAEPSEPDENAPAGESTGADQDPRAYRCAACGAHFDPGDWFCRKCGSRLY